MEDEDSGGGDAAESEGEEVEATMAQYMQAQSKGAGTAGD